jgi:hypothetical protein
VRGDEPSGFGQAHAVSLAPAGTGVTFGGPPLVLAAAVVDDPFEATLAFFLPLLRVRTKNRTKRTTTTAPMMP